MKKLIQLLPLCSHSGSKWVCFHLCKFQILHSSSLVEKLPVSSRSTRTGQLKERTEIPSFGSLFKEISEILGADNCINNGENHSVVAESSEELLLCAPPVCENANESFLQEKEISSIVNEISEVVRADNGYASMEERLENLGCSFDSEIVEKVLKRCFKLPHLAIQFFNWVKIRDGFSHSTSIFNTVFAIAGEMKNFELVEKLVDEMEKNSCEKDIKTWTILISIYGKAKLVGKTLFIYNAMRKSGFDPDQCVYKTIIDSLCNAGKPELAMEFYREMVQKKIILPTRIYKLLIKSLAKSGDTTSVLNLANDAITLSKIHETNVYNSVLESFCISGRIREALEYIRDLKTKGITFNSEYYMILVKGLCRTKRISDALEILNIMESKDIVNGKIYGIFINYYLQRNEISRAFTMFQTMKESGHLIEISTYTQLMQHFFNLKEYEKGFELYNEMQERGIKLDSVALMAVISGHIRNNNTSEALRIFKSIEKDEIKPSGKLFSVLIMELCEVSKIDEVIEVLNDMNDAKIVVKDELFDWIISYLRKNGDITGLEKVKHMQNIRKTIPQTIENDNLSYSEPEKTGCRIETLEKTYNEQDLVKICRILSCCVDWNTAEEELEKSSVRFSPKLVVDILSRCNIHGRAALNFFAWVGRQDGYSQTSETYNTAIKLAGRGKDFKHMRRLFYEMRRNGYGITADTWTIMIMQYGRIGLTDIALGIFEEMKASKCNPSSNTYKYLIITLCQKKGRKVEAAINLFQEMIRIRYIPDKELIEIYLGCLCKADRLSDARACVDLLCKIGFSVPLSYSFYSRALYRVGKLDEALELAEEIGSERSTLDQYTYGSLIHAFLRKGNLEEALSKINSLKNSGINPSVQVYTSLIIYFFKQNQIRESMKIFGRMIQEGVEPTIVTYSAMIRGFIENGKLAEASRVFGLIKEEGPWPDFRTYSMLITCLCETGKSTDSMELLSEMINGGITPSSVNFRTVFFGLNREGKQNLARNVLYQKSAFIRSRKFFT